LPEAVQDVIDDFEMAGMKSFEDDELSYEDKIEQAKI